MTQKKKQFSPASCSHGAINAFFFRKIWPNPPPSIPTTCVVKSVFLKWPSPPSLLLPGWKILRFLPSRGEKKQKRVDFFFFRHGEVAGKPSKVYHFFCLLGGGGLSIFFLQNTGDWAIFFQKHSGRGVTFFPALAGGSLLGVQSFLVKKSFLAGCEQKKTKLPHRFKKQTNFLRPEMQKFSAWGQGGGHSPPHKRVMEGEKLGGWALGEIFS